MENYTRVNVINNYGAPIYVGSKMSETINMINPGISDVYTLKDNDRLVAKSALRAQLYELEIDLRDYNFVEVEAYNNLGELDFRITDEVPREEVVVMGGGSRYELFY